MVASEFIDYLNKFEFLQKSGLYDMSDRCTYILTFTIILICSAVVTIKSYVLDPMSCYVATDVSGANTMAYINNYCWITGTYPKEVHQHGFDNDDYWKSLEPSKIHYYQWVPLVLGLQAALIYLPYVVWEALVYNRMGANLQLFIDAGRRCSLDYGPSRLAKVQALAGNMYVLLKSRQMRPSHRQTSCLIGAPSCRSRYEVVLLYLALKVASLVAVLAQFPLLASFLHTGGTRYWWLGFNLLHDLVNGRHWQQTHVFPRMGFCRVPFKLQSTQVVNVLAQCSLSVNMLNEKIFVFLWLWFCFLVLLQFGGLILWIWRCMFVSRRRHFLWRSLQVLQHTGEPEPELVHQSESRFIGPDGVFLLHMVRINCGDLVSAELTRQLLHLIMARERPVLLAMALQEQQQRRWGQYHDGSGSSDSESFKKISDTFI